MALKLTRRGLLVLSLAMTSLAISVTTSDVLMLGFSLTLLSLVAADALHTYVTTRTRCACVKCDEVYRGWVWEERELTVELGCGRALGVARGPSWVRILGTTVDRGRVVVNLRTSFRFYGRYRLWLEVLRGGRLGLCRAVEHVDSGPEFVVYPETLYWVLRALALLGLRGGFTVEPSGVYTYALAEAGEYVGSREYVPGSSLRRIDWRSTAKFGRLYVKEFSLGEAPSEVLLVDPRCIGRYTCDRIASAVLSVALSRYGAEFPLAVCRTDGGGCRVFSGGRELLLYVLDLVLKLGVVDCDQLYEFVKPTAAEAIRKLLGGSGRGVVVAERDALARADTLYVVSTLLHDARSVLDLLDSVRGRGVRCVVLTAPRPWLDARSLSEAYAIYRSFTNVVEALRSSGAEVVAADRWGR